MLSKDQTIQLESIIADHAEAFGDVSRVPAKVPPGRIELKPETPPPYIRGYKPLMKPEAKDYIEKNILHRLEALGIVIPYVPPANGAFVASPTLAAEAGKMDAEGKSIYRMVVAPTQVNKITIPVFSAVPLDVMQHQRALGGSKFLGSFDLSKCFFQLPLDPTSQYLTSFITPDGRHMMFTRLPMGAQQSPGLSSQSLTSVFHDSCILYVDNLDFGAETFEEFCVKLVSILSRAIKFGVKFSALKTFLGFSEIKTLGRIVSGDKITLAPESIVDVQKWQRPSSKKGLQGFIGSVNQHRDFVSGLGLAMAPLTRVTGKGIDGKKLEWSASLNEAFEQVKSKFGDIQPIYQIVPGIPIEIFSDASLLGIGAVLTQVVEGVRRTVAYISHAFSDVQSCNRAGQPLNKKHSLSFMQSQNGGLIFYRLRLKCTRIIAISHSSSTRPLVKSFDGV